MEQSLQELARQLQQQLDALSDGALSVDELVQLTDTAREVYERLIALRYAAMERLVKDEVTDESESEPFRLDALPGQISLIDAIEEVTRAAGHDDGPETPKQVSAAPETPEATAHNEENRDADSPSIASPEAAEEEPSIPTAVSLSAQLPRTTIREQANNGKTIADKLRLTPIEDLRKAIGLNQKFQYINELFDGDSTRYNLLIDEVNSAASLDDALRLLSSGPERIANLDEEDGVAQSLITLVERRFL
jgi:hypothetical protein